MLNLINYCTSLFYLLGFRKFFFFLPDFHEQKKEIQTKCQMTQISGKGYYRPIAFSFQKRIKDRRFFIHRSNLCNGQVIPPFRRSFQTFTNRGKQRREFKMASFKVRFNECALQILPIPENRISWWLNWAFFSSCFRSSKLGFHIRILASFDFSCKFSFN